MAWHVQGLETDRSGVVFLQRKKLCVAKNLETPRFPWVSFAAITSVPQNSDTQPAETFCSNCAEFSEKLLMALPEVSVDAVPESWDDIMRPDMCPDSL